MWAVTRSGSPDDDVRVEWADFDAAVFEPFAGRDPELTAVLLDAFETSFLRASGLDAATAPSVRAEVGLQVGSTPKGAPVIRLMLPFGLGEPSYGWDGSREHAVEIVESAGTLAGEDLASECCGSPAPVTPSSE